MLRIFLLLITCFSLVSTCPAQSTRPTPPVLSTHPVDPPVRLPDGAEFVTWDVPLTFEKTYSVDANHPQASDRNPGTKDRPFQTISRAADVLQPGQRVVISAGVYRERVRPIHGGTGPKRMISYEAAPGAEVVISGSKVLHRRWLSSKPPDDSPAVRGAYAVTLPKEAFVDSDENPFAKKNLTDEEIKRAMPWATSTMGSKPNQLRRGLVFQDGRRLEQVLAYADLAAKRGCYWVAPDGLTLHVVPFKQGDPNRSTWEYTVHGFVFAPEEYGLGYIRLKGLTVQHAGNRFPRPQAGAVSTQRGHHWIIEDCTVRQVNAIGIDIGDQFFVHRKIKLAQNGRHILRRNRVEHCGIGGIEGKDIYHTLIEDNLVTHCGWHAAYGIFETGGMKFHLARHCLLRRNIVLHTTEGPGIWLDWDIQNSRITRNLVVDVDRCGNGGILIEASIVPNLVDTNVVWDVQGPGIKNIESDHLIVAHNVVGRTTRAGFEIQGLHRGRKIGQRLLTYKRNRVLNNVFYDTRGNIDFSDERDNHADGNLILHRFGRRPFNLEAWRARGYGKKSSAGLGAAELNLRNLTLKWAIRGKLPTCLPVDHVHRTFQGKPIGKEIVPGPFGVVPTSPATVSVDPRTTKQPD
jgi:alpha-L-arabinofuranosidase